MSKTRFLSLLCSVSLLVLVTSVASAADVFHRIEAKAMKVRFADSFEVSRYLFVNDGKENEHLVLNHRVGDVLTLKVVNRLSFEIGFSNNGKYGTALTVAPGDSAEIVWTLQQAGYCRIKDHLSTHGAYMGLTGVLLVMPVGSNDAFFMWDLSDFEGEINEVIAKDNTPDFSTYRPDFFTINGKVYPQSETDSLVKIKGRVDEVITLVIINSGKAAHSIHFHGYHVTVVSTHARKLIEGATKDTVPIETDEVMVLELVPDKPGEYPVHNHALNGVISSGLYPSGQFSIMSIGK